MTFNRNVPGWERILRFILGAGALAATQLVPLAEWQLWAGLAVGATLIGTAGLGFCPACAMIGRKSVA